MLGKWGWKHVAQKFNFPRTQNIIHHTVTENKFITETIVSTSLYLFEFSNNDNIIMCETCSELITEAPDTVLGLWC